MVSWRRAQCASPVEGRLRRFGERTTMSSGVCCAPRIADERFRAVGSDKLTKPKELRNLKYVTVSPCFIRSHAEFGRNSVSAS